MKLPDDIKDFLPRYLTEESTQVLLQQIDDYAKEGTTDKVYAYPLSNDETIYQGDGICDLPIFQYKLRWKRLCCNKICPLYNIIKYL